MAKCILKNGIELCDFGKPYVVAEANSSHRGDFEAAKRMIKTAKEIGCDCIKFQSWSPETLYSNSYYRANVMAKRIVKKLSFTKEQLKELAEYSKTCGIDFASTPYCVEEARWLVKECDVPFLKISSMEINNLEFLKELASFSMPLILSTGMATMEEIKKAVSCIEANGNPPLCILHCVSRYPAPADEINLLNIAGLREEFPEYPIGYSDHTEGCEVAAGAVALGAALLEKHFTLDNTKMGMDNQMATPPEKMEKFVSTCYHVYSAMGIRERILSEYEMEQQAKMRRSVVTTKALEAGHVIEREDLCAKRPGDGIPVTDLSQVIGKRIKESIEADEVLNYENLH